MKKLLAGLVLSTLVLVFAMTVTSQDNGSSTVTVEGQVVCSSCWFEADRRVTPYGSKDDIKCAATCAKSGKSQAIAVAGKDGYTLYLLEPGKLKRDRQDWLDYIARRVKASGTLRKDGDKSYLRVDSIELTK